jgi:hypothetical protein
LKKFFRLKIARIENSYIVMLLENYNYTMTDNNKLTDQINDLKNKLTESSSCLVFLPKEVSLDQLAGALAIFLALKQAGKSVSILSESELKVGQSHLFGIGEIKNSLPENSSGNFLMRFDGVVENGKVPALTNLDWHPDGSALELVFHVAPGKKFEPINISYHHDTAGFNLIFFVGGSNLADFGSLFESNLEKLGDGLKVNISNSQNNNPFGAINIVEPEIASLSEIMAQVIQGLGLPQDQDIASNIIAGIYDATKNLTENVSADTFIVVGSQMHFGGKIPTGSRVDNSGFDIRQLGQSSKPAPVSQPEAVAQAVIQPAGDQAPSLVSDEAVKEAVEEGVSLVPAPIQEQIEATAPAKEEIPTGEFATTTSSEAENPSPDWLTPKIFKGGGLG